MLSWRTKHWVFNWALAFKVGLSRYYDRLLLRYQCSQNIGNLWQYLLVLGLSDSNAGIGGIEGVTILDNSLSELWLNGLSLLTSPRGGGGVCAAAGEFLDGDTPRRKKKQKINKFMSVIIVKVEQTKILIITLLKFSI